MNKYFQKVIDFTYEASLEVVKKDEHDELLIVSNEDKGICNLIVDCEFPILIMEQLIYKIQKPDEQIYKRLLQMNRLLIHGAFVLDEDGKSVIFRDTLQLENLDFNEFEGSINALSIGLAEFSKELIELNSQ